MNAYELADRLENELNLSENLFVFDAANMLRQQADRIKELETKYEQEFKYGENLLKEKNDHIYN